MKSSYSIRLPNTKDPEKPKIVLESFPTREEALEYAVEILGTTEEGLLDIIFEDDIGEDEEMEEEKRDNLDFLFEEPAIDLFPDMDFFSQEDL